MSRARIILSIFPVICLLCALACVNLGTVQKTVPAPEIREIGIPVRSVNWIRLHPGADQKGDPCLYATMGQQGDNLFVLQIDPETGKFRQFVSKVPESNYPTATWMSRSGKLYVGAAYAGHLLCFDPEKNALEDLGAINGDAATFPCRIDEDAEGRIWIGSYGSADLTCYNPKTREFTRYGRMDDVDMYNYPLVNADKTIANLIRMTEPHVVVLDPRTKEKRTVGPTIPKGEGNLDLQKGNDGKLYIVSSKGNFRIDGMNAVPVDSVPNPAPNPTLPDGSTFQFIDSAEQTNRKLQITKANGDKRVFDLDYEAAGSEIFYVHLGPDGLIYGSSILPLHLFRYDPQTGELVDLGTCSAATGEAYSMANLDGKMYISSYPQALISVYDPSRPYHFGKTPEDNPRDLGRVDNISYRPRSTLAGPLGRVWLASIPDYGMWGGPLSYYDPQTDERKAYYRIVGDGTCYTLAHLEKQNLIAVGTTIHAGSGTQPKVDQAVLFLWDYKAEKKVWEGTLDRPVNSFNALVVGSNGKLYGTVAGGDVPREIFEFDPRKMEFTNRIPTPEGGVPDLGLQNGPDGMIYGFTSDCIYRLNPKSLEITVLVQKKGSFEIAGPIVGKDIYFAKGPKLMAVRMFE
ncbi:MAG TPA: hypothetical protein PLZ55_01265 [bacterium]|nr:hypothetical protein [bacterium]